MKEIFSTEQQERIVQAITVAESMTSGEIRLVVDRKLSADSALDAAVAYFRKLNMHKTALKNGVLIYLATEDHAFAIIGDEGINVRVAADFWDDTKEQMVSFFRTGDVVEGLITGIHHAGEQLKHYFPRRADDVNELPDEIHFGNN
ncbi:TPM domain-containing protein [Sphingobacterium oryzagri]|uniref:TPM domain-containing protein n=1 Tax=Sphingobacterium oryzagri TaxID=3025669 RepID=A0ABY7WGB4_9SPHI|nr:TPM domain-containing protein [Sphingobacterium sp. KACC 22765]WDF68567.1 TPM domain-containing protein [Sphingobacterium sp. KACC 22765]